jgi:ABC-2 type transport system ATP-binding protein
MADRVGVINQGKIIVVEEKHALMQKLGKKQMTLNLTDALAEIPKGLGDDRLALSADRKQLVYTYDAKSEQTGISEILKQLDAKGITFRDLQTKESSLEDIFVNLVGDSR